AVFDRAPDGEIALTREGGHHADRIVHAGGDATGAEVSRALVAQLEAVLSDPGIEVIEHALVLDVLTGPAGPDGRPGAVCGGRVRGPCAARAPTCSTAAGCGSRPRCTRWPSSRRGPSSRRRSSARWP